jgi:hypothetical protein
MGDQTCCGYHVCAHAITNEQDNVLGLANFIQVSDEPLSRCLISIVVCQGGDVFTRLVQSDFAVGFAGDFHQTRFVGISGKEVCDSQVGSVSDGDGTESRES